MVDPAIALETARQVANGTRGGLSDEDRLAVRTVLRAYITLCIDAADDAELYGSAMAVSWQILMGAYVTKAEQEWPPRALGDGGP